MKVLITGAGGQLGGALVKSAPPNIIIRAIDLPDVDLTNAAHLREFIQVFAPSILVNAAAYTQVDKAESQEELAHAINADAVRVMGQEMEALNGKLVHVSTDFVFDGLSKLAYAPDSKVAPLSVYGRTKAAGEAHLRAEDILVRTAWVYEAGGANFVRTMLRLMRERTELGVVSDQIGAPTWASGLAGVIWGLVLQGEQGTFHHSDSGVASWYDFAVAIAEEAHAIGLIDSIPDIKPIASEEYPTPAQRPTFSLLDCRKTRKCLGVPAVHWRRNLRLMLKEEKALG